MTCRQWWTGLVLAAAMVPGAAVAQDPGAPAAPLDADIETAPVVVDGVELFSVRGVASYPALRRASDISERIVRLGEDLAVAQEGLTLGATAGGTEIRAGGLRIVTVTEYDAQLERVSTEVLAERFRIRIQESMRAFREARTRNRLSRAFLLTLVALALVVVALRAVRWFSRRITASVERRFRIRVQSLAIGSFEFVRADRLWGYLRGALRGVHAAVELVLIYLFLDFALRQYPWTRGAAAQLDDWALRPVQILATGLVRFLPNLIFLAVLYLLTRWALQLVLLFFDSVGSGEVTLQGFEPHWAAPTFKLIRVAIVVFAVVIAYPYVPGSESAAFKGVSILIGLVFSLGSSSAISNTIAGYSMIYRRLFREGDWVKIGEVVGAVSEIRLQVTHLRTAKNEEAVVPNSTILNSEVINYSSLAKSDGLILHTTVGIGYEVPWRQVEAMLLLAAARTPGLAAGRQHFVLQKSLGDFAVIYELNTYVEDPTRMPVLYSELHRQVLDVFNEFNVQVMTPAYRNDPADPKVVPRERWWSAPASPPAAELPGGG